MDRDSGNDSYECDGYFWLPQDPEATGFGRLKVDRDGSKLELIDAGWDVTETSRLRVLHGRSWDGHLLTLLRPFRGPWTFSGDPTRNRSIWWADDVVMGAHVASHEEVMADHWSISIPHLNWWLRGGERKHEALLRLAANAKPGGTGKALRVVLDGAVLTMRLSGPADLLTAGNFTRDSFRSWLAAWYDFHASMAEARVLWFDTVASPKLPVENTLLNFVAFAEGYHRQSDVFPQAPYGDGEHKGMVDAMLATLPDDGARKQYRGALEHANSRPQSRRMRDLIARAAKVEPKLKPRGHRLLGTVMDTRHWLTHWGARGERVVEGVELLLAVEQLQFVLEANLLLDFFEDKETARTIIRRSYRGGNLMELKPEPGGRNEDL